MNANNVVSSLAVVVCCLAVLSAAAPFGLAAVPLALVPLAVAPAPVVTAYSSQYVARNYNGIAVAPAVVPSAAFVSYPQYPRVFARAAAVKDYRLF